ncbi:uncharacterized protein LOC130404594 [Gadus chalcogrammus]|uniref:uncharacterized protein LOC130404594 n=1 Tax=Gadus chalcogrammus TaxID=1042646 RepID=UPI0024C4C54E|nr:uncharacterized protein LOC130404594 [Gadus chalcogrammus]
MASLVGTLLRKVNVKESKKTSFKLITWLQKKRLLQRKVKCKNCRHKMKMVYYTQSTDLHIWECRRKRCGRLRRSVRTKSLFSNSHCSLFTWMKYIHRFAQGLQLRQVDMLQDGITKSTATLSMMSKKLRRICLKSLKRHRKEKGQKIGGVNAIVHIDESKFCHKRKYGRGRFGNSWRRKRTWVFGMLQIKRSDRRPILRLVQRRNKETLVPIIKKHVKHHSLVVSDEWRAYAGLATEGYRHVRVNHSQHYVDPQTGLHTQNLERAWQTYKKEIWRMRGNRSEKALKEQLCFIEWTYWLARKNSEGVLGRLVKDIRRSYQK